MKGEKQGHQQTYMSRMCSACQLTSTISKSKLLLQDPMQHHLPSAQRRREMAAAQLLQSAHDYQAPHLFSQQNLWQPDATH